MHNKALHRNAANWSIEQSKLSASSELSRYAANPGWNYLPANV